MRFNFLSLSIVGRATLICLFAAGFGSSASAIPVLEDFWRLDCDVKVKTLEDFQEDIDDAESEAAKGIALLKYACAVTAEEFLQYEKQYLAYAHDPKGAPPKIDRSRSAKYKKQALLVLQKAFKAGATSPEVLYYYGFALAFGNDEWAVNRFDSAAKEYSESNYPELSTLALGEFLFDLRGLKEAQTYYKRAVETQDPFTKAYATYKMAWIKLTLSIQKKNLAEQYSAIQSIGNTINAEGSGHKLAGLKVRAKEDLLNILREYKDMNHVRKILTNVKGMDMYATVLANRGYLYAETGDSDAAYKHFQLALAEAKAKEMAPELEFALLAIDAEKKRIDKIVDRLKKMPALYGDDDSSWGDKQTDELLESTQQQMIQATYEYATGLDAQGRKEENKAYLTAARNLYEHFITAFPKAAQNYDAKFYLAQLILNDKQYDLAAKHFDALHEEFSDGNHAKETLDFLIASTQQSMADDKTNYGLPQPGTGKDEIDLPRNRELYVKALDNYEDVAENHPDQPTMKYLAASIYYDFGHYDEAEDRLVDFIEDHPTHEEVINAVERMLVYYKAQDVDEVEDFIEDLNEIKALANNKMLQVLLTKPKGS